MAWGSIVWKSLEAFVDRNAEALMFVLFPLVANLSLGARSFFLHPDEFTNDIPACWAVVLTAVLTSLTALWAFAILEMPPKRSLIILLLQQLALILVFAGVYRGYGLMYGGPAPPALAPGSPLMPLGGQGGNALYFSVVTWTTLGYGDFTPPPELRLIAAFQALTGYLFFGLIVGLGTHLISRGGDRTGRGYKG